jgi:HK97 family phage portal protein
VILATRQGDKELRTANLAAFGISPRVGGVATAVTVNPSTASGLPACTAAVRIAAEGVASLDLGVWRGKGVERVAVPNAWQARIAASPNEQQTSYGFWETIEESLSYRGNAYIWKNVSNGRVVEWYALHPDQIRPLYTLGARKYVVGAAPYFIDPTGKGIGFYTVGQDTILHIKGFGDGGMWIAPSPVERFRQALGVGLAKINYETSLYARSAMPGMVVTVPGELDKEQMDSFRESFAQLQGGSGNVGRTAVVGGGITVAPIGFTMTDSQFIESMQFDVEQVARIFNVPQSLIGGGGIGGTSAAVAPKTPEHEQARWLKYGLVPRLRRIEAALYADAALFPANSALYPMFDTDRALRGDLATEAAIAQGKVQSGQWTPNEARALDGLAPLGYMVEKPDGSGEIDAGDIPQITPVGGGPNPDMTLPPAAG